MGRNFVVILLMMGALFALTPAPASALQMRWDETGPFLWGNMSWGSNGGRIVWGPNPSTVDDQPAPGGADSVQTMQRRLQYTRTDLLGLPAVPDPDVFVSDPLPATLFMNASRSFQLELFLKANTEQPKPCSYMYNLKELGPYASSSGGGREPSLNVELHAGDRVIGGARPDDQPQFYYVHQVRSFTPPPDPQGYGTCRYSMATEMAIIPEGTVLSLKVIHARQVYDYPYGLQGDHQSRIRIPLYPPDEVVFRYPELLDEEEEPEPTSEDGGEPGTRVEAAVSLLPVLLGVTAGLGTLRDRRSRGWILAFLFVAGVMSGCLTNKASDRGASGSDDPLKGNVENTFVKDGSGLAGTGFGTILGQVHDDLHVPIPNVHVSMLGLADFATTNGKGRFQFANLLPGIYKLRFDANGYKSFEADVEVKSGFVSRPSIMLFLKNAKDRDYRPHSHDYWDGKTTKDLGTIKLAESCAGTGAQTCTTPKSFRLAPRGEDSNTILPGTREVEVSVNWDPSAQKVDRLGFYIKNNDGFVYYPPNYYYVFNYSVFAPRAPNVPFRIQTAWEATDVGHQRFSTWEFGWYIAEPDKPTPEEQREMGQPNYHPGDVEIKVKIHKGSLPLEAPHPDHWAGSDRVQIIKGQQLGMSAEVVPPSSPVKPPFVCYIVCTGRTQYPTAYLQKLVPAETLWVEVKLRIDPPPTTHYDWTLKYKPANLPYSQPYKLLDSTTSAGGVVTWKFALKPGEADAEYARQTGWGIAFEPKDKDAFWSDYNTRTGFGVGQSYATAAGFGGKYAFVDMWAGKNPP